MNYNWYGLPVVDEVVTVALTGFGNCTLPTSGSLFRVDANHTATQPVRQWGGGGGHAWGPTLPNTPLGGHLCSHSSPPPPPPLPIRHTAH